ncbi:MAG: acyl-CoA desaturase [Anaeromyxobacter sp.]
MTSAAPRVHFPRDDGFHEDLKARAEAWLARTGKRATGDAAMKAKTATIFAWHLGAYALLLALGPGAPLLSAALVLSLALSTVGIGFAIMHDANHGSWSGRRFVNRLVGLSLDAIGGSSYVWRHKHNVRHHTYANIEGLDADLEAEPFLRLAPGQRRRAWHRFQHLYAWPIYGFLAPKWWLVDDAKDLLTGRIGQVAFPRPPAGELALAVLGKVFFLTWSLAVPLLVFRTPWVLAYWFGGAMVAGVVLAVVFQLAHVVPAAEFHAAGEPGRKMPTGWAEHQVRTTVDFAPGSPLLTWYLGGLNYQVVHHLLPMYCHVHYPALAGIVAETCRDHGIPYRSEPTLLGALRGHGRLLRNLGRPLVSGAAARPLRSGLTEELGTAEERAV